MLYYLFKIEIYFIHQNDHILKTVRNWDAELQTLFSKAKNRMHVKDRLFNPFTL